MNDGERLSAYLYDLPEDRIAEYPADRREESKLLVYNGEISHSGFRSIPAHLPENAHLVFNDTRVIPARVNFYKTTGASIEVFLLEPVAPSADMAVAMAATESCTWKCMVGNLKKWKSGDIRLVLEGDTLTATLVNREEKHVRFRWSGGKSFAEIIARAGRIPLPPYIKREVEEQDADRYQTIYSQTPGAVAAPTAGLHFTEEILQVLQSSGHELHYLTLHVGAGTFQPIKTERFTDHRMHEEHFLINRTTVEKLSKAPRIIPVGTTSLRTLESLYWYGCKLIAGGGKTEFNLKSSDIERLTHENISRKESLNAVLELGDFQSARLKGRTSIFIYPGYRFRMTDGLITNFHLPGSSLILLVAALVGNKWKDIYHSALKEGYRFLSYGDSSLLLPPQNDTVRDTGIRG